MDSAHIVYSQDEIIKNIMLSGTVTVTVVTVLVKAEPCNLESRLFF